jgi:hypothetical protein
VVVVPEARCDDDEDGTPVFSCVAAMGKARLFFIFDDDGSATEKHPNITLFYSDH